MGGDYNDVNVEENNFDRDQGWMIVVDMSLSASSMVNAAAAAAASAAVAVAVVVKVHCCESSAVVGCGIVVLTMVTKLMMMYYILGWEICSSIPNYCW